MTPYKITLLMRCKECKRKLKSINDTNFYCDSSPNMCSLSTKTINKYKI